MASSKRYSQHARRAISHAKALAKKYRHPSVNSTHLLIGILNEEGSVGSNILQELQMDLRHVERAFRQIAEQQPVNSRSTPLDITPGLHDALELAADEAQWLGQNHVGTEHLLLGLARGSEESLVTLFHVLEVNPEQIRRQVRRLLQDGITEISIEQAKRIARLSELSRRVLNATEQAADRMGHKEVGLAHLLLVLTRERRSVCSGFLREAGLDDADLEANLTKPHPALGGMLEDVIDRAVHRAEKLGSHYTGTEHLLLALALDPRGARLLRKYNVDPPLIVEKLQSYLQN